MLSECLGMLSFWLSLLSALILQAVGDTSWPKGKYALLQPTTGCPDGWQGKGSLYQDTEDTNPSNNRSEILHIDGFVSSSFVIRSFCVKTTTTTQARNWPQGRYCIYRKRNERTLTTMADGLIKMYDETSYNKDTAIYVSYSNWILYSLSQNYKYLLLYFQCKTDGNTAVPISLPITKPFYLLPYGSRDCQQVKWMVATSEWINYHTRNYINRRGQTSGKVPYHELGDINHKGITMFYCYYQSCNYTLTNKKGVFQSPGFPGKYPDGQLCSWRIMVPDNHTVLVHFSNFSLDGNDTKDVLESYKYINDTFQLDENLHGIMEPFTIVDTNDLLFKFVSNQENHTLGFRAEYTVFIPSETTHPPSSTPSSSPTTKTDIPTEHISERPTTTESTAKNRTAFALEAKCKGVGTIVVIVIPLVCLLVVVIVVVFVVRRYRLAQPKPETNEERIQDKIATNPIYDQGDILLNERGSLATITTTMDFNDEQMYQTLTRDQKTATNEDYSDGKMYQCLSHDQKPAYESPYDPSTGSAHPKYHELEPVDNKVPDVVYEEFEGPSSNKGPLDDQMYQELDDQSTPEPLYQYTSPGAMVTQNHLYGSSA